MAQQEELLKHKRELEDMKAALVIACGALKETNYMDPNVSCACLIGGLGAREQ